jgi:hypothetical protein
VKPALDKDARVLARASSPSQDLVLKAADGQAVTAAMRDDLLAKCAAGQYVELTLELLAFEQKPDEQNRNFVRFRDGAMMSLGRSGVGTPFLRDHDQWDSLARGGTIMASRAEKRGEGDYAIYQTVKLTAPWAVELALRGLMSTVSIGWNPTGKVECTVCGRNFYSYECSHYPGQAYVKEGTKDQLVICERLYTSAELIETSAVPVPAVPSAQIDEIRAALATAPDVQKGFRATSAQEESHMSIVTALAAILSLPTTAGESEVIKSVESLSTSKKLIEQQRDELSRDIVEVRAKLAGYEQTLARQAEDKFIEDGVRAGKIIPGTQFEQALRAYHGKDADGAKALLAGSPVVTPVGQPRLSTQPAPQPAVVGSPVDAAIAAAGGDPAKIRADLKRDGLSEAAIEKQLAAMVSGKAA